MRQVPASNPLKQRRRGLQRTASQMPSRCATFRSRCLSLSSSLAAFSNSPDSSTRGQGLAFILSCAQLTCYVLRWPPFAGSRAASNTEGALRAGTMLALYIEVCSRCLGFWEPKGI